jgi:hypothetical protein
LGTVFRLSCALALVLLARLYVSGFHLAWFTIEQICIVVLIILLFSGADRALSVCMKLRHGSVFSWEARTVLPQRLIAIQVTATFAGAGWSKLVARDWANGEILAHLLVSVWATPSALWIARLHLPMWVFDWGVRGVKVFELLLPVCLWTRWWKWWLVGMALFLSNIAVLFGFWWFLVLVPASITFREPRAVLESLKRLRP